MTDIARPISDDPRPPATRPYLLVQGGRPAPVAAGPADPARNRILGELPYVDLGRLAPDLVRARLAAGRIIEEGGASGPYAWFPETAVVSLRCDLADGATTEVAQVGCEGMIGLGTVLGGAPPAGLAVVGLAGWAWRLPVRTLERECERTPVLRRAVMRHVHELLAAVAQNAACSRHHAVAQRLSRYLLQMHERAATAELPLTHEAIAAALGVRRECVTVAAGVLRRAGAIEYRRGRLRVLRAAELESRACECHGALHRMQPRPDAAGKGAAGCTRDSEGGARRLGSTLRVLP